MGYWFVPKGRTRSLGHGPSFWVLRATGAGLWSGVKVGTLFLFQPMCPWGWHWVQASRAPSVLPEPRKQASRAACALTHQRVGLDPSIVYR